MLISVLIGIDASRAFINNRTGIEEYSYQVIKHLIPLLKDDQARLASTSGFRESRRVVLYIRNTNNSQPTTNNKIGDFELPNNWNVKVINWPYLWTQAGLSLELLFHPVDILFVPAHTVPFIHPKNTVVTIHGLEYEFCPDSYSLWERIYMRFSIINSCRWTKKIIAVSENTKKDLMKLYKVPEEKIEVIYEGCNIPETRNLQPKIQSEKCYELQVTGYSPYLLFIGRLEERKNIIGIIRAFEILKEQYKVPHKLILAGKFGYGEQKIRDEIKNVNCAKDIILPGYVSEEEKWKLLKKADVFLFPTFYEGFGLPILEAQSVGVAVIASNNSSVPEISTNYEFYETTNSHACHSERSDSEVEESNKNEIRSLGYARDDKSSVILVNPRNCEEIADAAHKLISDDNLRNDIIKRGYENVKRFSWERCAEKVAEILTK